MDRQIVLNDLRVVNPRSPGDDLLEADRCELEFAAQPLLRKQGVVDHGRVSGLRFSAFSGDAMCKNGSQDAAPQVSWNHDESDATASQWFAHLAERFQHKMLDRLESIQRTEAFCANWSSQSAILEVRGEALNERVAELQAAVEAANANPLRGEKVFADLPKKIADLQKDFADLNADLAAATGSARSRTAVNCGSSSSR